MDDEIALYGVTGGDRAAYTQDITGIIAEKGADLVVAACKRFRIHFRKRFRIIGLFKRPGGVDQDISGDVRQPDGGILVSCRGRKKMIESLPGA